MPWTSPAAASRAEAAARGSVTTRTRIAQRLHDSVAPADPEAQARAAWPPAAAAALFPAPLVPAAVLLPLVERAPGLSVLLTRRTDHLRDHPGQVSFPGGRVERGDAGPLATALREAGEELGIEASRVTVAGYLPAQAIVTGFVVTPVVGFLSADIELRPDTFEVAEAFEVPLAFILDPVNLMTSIHLLRGVEVPVFEYHYAGHRIWGATAKMLHTLSIIVKTDGY
ncbi:MAG: CoA pyrophosphatase [Gammaproteobacteria bacterium]|nr:CoA pyrophosphatase [Gammaproteobacteria bacterium]